MEKIKDISKIYGCDVFNLKTIEIFVSKPTYTKFISLIKTRTPLDEKIAEKIANAMKRWAISKGATHYTHWFQPLNGSVAEKHDSFFSKNKRGEIFLNFSGKALIKGEPDASSFPSGGLRATFEARGYTAWDPSSPVFIRREDERAILCIPSAYYSYNGEALDKKIPLLRSVQSVSYQVKRLLKCFEKSVHKRVQIFLGAEQEYFLIDKKFYKKRQDLIQTGHTLFGKIPPKNQQLSDHYFGAIKPRVLKYMADVDEALWRLGIPAKTRHNEVAPSQFEIASEYEELNKAVDHNMLIMEVLKQIATKHDFVCLLHEKPYHGLNGSGKHNNWSIGVDDVNLLDPGNEPQENAIFLTVICAIIQSIDRHSDILSASTSSAGNDMRLGQQEAPPNIISIFLGENLTKILEEIESGLASNSAKIERTKVGVNVLPTLPKDISDRNRTSPFVFTGDKFEFRTVGSNQSCSGPNIVLNTIISESIDEIASKLEKIDIKNFNKELQKILAEIIKKHKRIVFNGDNYSKEWEKEAKKRGFKSFKNTPDSLETFKKNKTIKLFEKYNILNEKELISRYNVYLEKYNQHTVIDGKLALDIAKTQILPAAIKQQNDFLDTYLKLCSSKISNGQKVIKEKINTIGLLIEKTSHAIEILGKDVENKDMNKIISSIGVLREHVDLLEGEVDNNLWPLTKYHDMIFI